MANLSSTNPQQRSEMEEIKRLWVGVVQSLSVLAVIATVFVAWGLRAEEVRSMPIPINQVVGVQEKGSQTTWYEVETEVFYPSACFDPLLSYAYVDRDSQRIVLFHFAKELDLICTQALEPHIVIHRVAGLSQGYYEIWDGVEERAIGSVDLRK